MCNALQIKALANSSLENGRAVLVAYRVFRGPHNRYGRIPGVLGRSEFALEIVVTIAYLVYVVGLSFDKVCLVLNFFQNLKLSKAQANTLLHQLARHWHKEFDVLCTLLANSLVVHSDETSWSPNSVWAFLSEKACVLLFGVHKDAQTLKEVLDPDSFAGIVISDDAAVYGHFTHAQKCWAHLLRKAIKLTLQDPNNEDYRRFADRLLVNEVMRLLLAEELFTFVTAKPVEQPNGEIRAVGGTNNDAERTLRNPASARKTGRTSKTVPGARRQTIVTSVLESLRLYLSAFTLPKVIEEVRGWLETGRSCFEGLLEELGLARPTQSILDEVLPSPSG